MEINKELIVVFKVVGKMLVITWNESKSEINLDDESETSLRVFYEFLLSNLDKEITFDVSSIDTSEEANVNSQVASIIVDQLKKEFDAIIADYKMFNLPKISN